MKIKTINQIASTKTLTDKYGICSDENGNTNLDADYLMYTCLNGIYNIRICLWKHS